MEPRAAAPGKRLETIHRLSYAGVPAAVLPAPMIPFLNDWELESILKAAAEAGAGGASYILLRLPLELKELFTEWLEAHAPRKARHVLNMVRESRGGKLYRTDFSTRMRGTGAYAYLLARRFQLACRRLGLNRTRGALEGLDTSRFRPPGRRQLRLL